MPAPKEFYVDPRIAKFAYDGSIAVNRFALMYLDTDDVKPAASHAEVTNEAGTQTAAGPKFAGLADTTKASNAAADPDFPVITDLTIEIDCVSATFEVGDYVTFAWNSDTSRLRSDMVKKTTTAAQRIGVVQRRAANATTRVLVRFISRVLPNYIPPA